MSNAQNHEDPVAVVIRSVYVIGPVVNDRYIEQYIQTNNCCLEEIITSRGGGGEGRDFK